MGQSAVAWPVRGSCEFGLPYGFSVSASSVLVVGPFPCAAVACKDVAPSQQLLSRFF